MIDLTDLGYVQGVKSNMHTIFDTPSGKEVLKFLEITCCWYQSVISPHGTDMTQVNDGKRQVIATIKTFLEFTPEQIVELAKRQGE